MLSASRSVTRNQKAKLAADYNDLLKELSSKKMTSVGCYSIGETIGTGAYGKVKLGIHKLTGQQVAIKKIDKQHAPLMAREIHHHRQLRHPNIVTLYEVIATESTIHLISEYCPNGELFDALADSGRFSEHRAQRFFNQITSAVRACHQQGIVHRDLKLENILLDSENNAKLCDFGFARYAENKQFLETFCGSLAYSAPEVIMCQKYTGPATDVWSLGVILFTLLAGELPFDDDSEIVIQRKIRNVDYEIPSYFSPEAADLIQRLLQLNPLERPTIDQVANHPWLHMTIDDDDHDNDSLSTRNSSHSEIDSIFSAPQRRNLDMLEEDEDETLTETSSRESYTSTHSKPPTFSEKRYIPTEAGRFQSQAHTSFPMSHGEERSRQNRPFSFTSTRPLSLGSSQPPVSGSSLYRDSRPRVEEVPLTRIEQQLVSSLKAAGFDSNVVKSMRSGTCDTLGTVWQMLLQRVDKTIEKPTDEYTKQSEMTTVAMKVDATISQKIQLDDDNTQDEEYNEKPSHTIPCLPASSIYGFGSERHSADKSGWFSSVRSWFAVKEPLRLKNQPSKDASSYRDFDTPSCNPTSPVQPVSSPPVYRTGSNKHRRRVLQLSNPPVNELDQLIYSATSPVHMPQPLPLSQARTSDKMIASQGPALPPVARTTGAVTDTLSIVTTDIRLSTTAVPYRATEFDMSEQCYAAYRSTHPRESELSPPPSPPNKASIRVSSERLTKPLPLDIPHSPIQALISPPSSPEEHHTLINQHLSNGPAAARINTSPLPPLATTPTTLSHEEPVNVRRFDFAPRTRLSAYGMSENDMRDRMSSKVIIEEEEEEEE